MAQKEKKSLYDRIVQGKEEAVKAAARNNATDEELAVLLECSPSSIKKLRKDNHGFCDLLKIDRDIADNIVEAALYNRAVGYNNEEVVTTTRKSGKPGTELNPTPRTFKIGDIQVTEITFTLSRAKEKEIWNILKKLDKCAGKKTAVQLKIEEIARRIKRVNVTTAFSQLMAVCKKHLRI